MSRIHRHLCQFYLKHITLPQIFISNNQFHHFGTSRSNTVVYCQESGYGDFLDSAQSLIVGAIASGAAEKLLGGILGGGSSPSHPSQGVSAFIKRQ